MTLADLGWNDDLAAAFTSHGTAGLHPARVTLQLKGFWEVTTPGTARLGEATGKFLHGTTGPTDLPAVGDWVAMEAKPGDDTRALIHAVLPRRTKFSRQAAGEHVVEQVVAANVDTVFLVSSLDANFNLRRIERYLAAARASGAQPVVVLNKSDLTKQAAGLRAEAEAIARGVPVVVTSALKRGGVKALAPWLRPRTTVAFLGSSGVGKSTLINELMGEEVQFTQANRAIDGKGRHTTTERELLVSPDGVLIIDTPGMRELQPWQAEEVVENLFADITALAGQCKFRDCTHGPEPGCAVQTALADGSLDLPRWHSYLRLGRENAYAQRQVNRLASLQTLTERKKMTKQLRRRIREKQGDD